MDLQGDEQLAHRSQRASQLRWDRKTKKFKKDPQQDGSAGPMIKTESGALLPATFDSGRFKEWARKRHNPMTVRASLLSYSYFAIEPAYAKRASAAHHERGSGQGDLLTPSDIRDARVSKAKVSLLQARAHRQRKIKNARPPRRKA